MDKSQEGFKATKDAENTGSLPLSAKIKSKASKDPSIVVADCVVVNEVKVPVVPYSEITETKNVTKGFTRRQWITLILFGVVNLVSAMIFSIQAPFYPKEAEIKGPTATEYGLVFGIFALTNFLSAPVFGKYMNRLGPKLVFNGGLFLTSISCISFGLLDGLNDHTMFITLSFILRITEALGATEFLYLILQLSLMNFLIMWPLLLIWGWGATLGEVNRDFTVPFPYLELGRYVLPFAVSVACLLILGVLSSFIMPKFQTVSDNDGNTDQAYGILSLLKIPSVFPSALCTTLASGNISFLSATLEPHLRQVRGL